MIILLEFGAKCSKALGVPLTDLRIKFTFAATPKVRCAVSVLSETTRLFGAGEDEHEAMAAVLAEAERQHAEALPALIERLESRERNAREAAVRAERMQVEKEAELRRTNERAARAAKAFQRVIQEEDRPQLPSGEEDEDG
jgi:hypothetical protein